MQTAARVAGAGRAQTLNKDRCSMGWIRCVGIASRYPTMAHFTKVMGGGGDRKGRVQFGQVYGRAEWPVPTPFFVPDLQVSTQFDGKRSLADRGSPNAYFALPLFGRRRAEGIQVISGACGSGQSETGVRFVTSGFLPSCQQFRLALTRKSQDLPASLRDNRPRMIRHSRI